MLYHCQPAQGNFGDDLNPWLWSRLAPEIAADKSSRLFLGIGTILTDRVPAEPTKVVFGSGYGYGHPPVVNDRWYIYAVRGPLTAQRLNISPKLAITDPALLLRGLQFDPAVKRFPISFMPHHQSLEHADWVDLCRNSALHCIDPRLSVDQVVEEIRGSALLLTEAMHGAIVADAFRIPFVPVQIYGNLNRFKWEDWAQSVGLELHLHDVPPIYTRPLFSPKGLREAAKKAVTKIGLGKAKWKRLSLRPSGAAEIATTLSELQRIAKTASPYLSKEATLGELQARLTQTLEKLRHDWRTDTLCHCRGLG